MSLTSHSATQHPALSPQCATEPLVFCAPTSNNFPKHLVGPYSLPKCSSLLERPHPTQLLPVPSRNLIPYMSATESPNVFQNPHPFIVIPSPNQSLPAFQYIIVFPYFNCVSILLGDESLWKNIPDLGHNKNHRSRG